jgi:hypothetical protein
VIPHFLFSCTALSLPFPPPYPHSLSLSLSLSIYIYIYIVSSDARMKKKISDANDDTALDKILNIQPKTYEYK